MLEIATIKKITEELNKYRDAYYNRNESIIPDEEYDKKVALLKKLEEQSGFVANNSPTQNVGFEVKSDFEKVKHDHPMLSLDKVKDLNELVKFCDGKNMCASLKLDGLTLSLSYDKQGNLIKAETRGDGYIGENVIDNVKFVSNIPLKINNFSLPLTVDGEVIVKTDVFESINAKLKDEDKFKHVRNYASGSLRQLDSSITKERKLTFIPWKFVSGYNNPTKNYYSRRLSFLRDIGFEVVPYIAFNLAKTNPELRIENIQEIIDTLKNSSVRNKFPIDGIVFAYDDLDYAESLGSTAHHPLHSIAFKFENEIKRTVLRDIEWNVGKTGMIAPVAVFDPVDLDGAVTNRATLHNVSIIKQLELGIGDEIGVIRSNEVIPKVVANYTKSNNYQFPMYCPSCGSPLTVMTFAKEVREGKGNKVKEVKTAPTTLWCVNNECPAKKLNRFVQFVSKDGMNIDGLSEATLDRFITEGFISTFRDIYHLDRFKDEIIELDGFGEKSYNKLIESIEKSKDTKLENILVAYSIPNIGKSAAKTISKRMKGSYTEFCNAINSKFDFTTLKDFGDIMNESIYKFFNSEYEKNLIDNVNAELYVEIEEEKEIQEGYFTNKKFCITGSFSVSRDVLKEKIENQGGIFVSGVSKKLDILVAGEKAGSKLDKAKELGIKIVDETELKEYIDF